MSIQNIPIGRHAHYVWQKAFEKSSIALVLNYEPHVKVDAASQSRLMSASGRSGRWLG